MTGPPQDPGPDPEDGQDGENDRGALWIAYGVAFGPLAGVLIAVLFDLDIGLAIALGAAGGLMVGAILYALRQPDAEAPDAEDLQGGGGDGPQEDRD